MTLERRAVSAVSKAVGRSEIKGSINKSVPLRSANIDAAGKVTICKASNKLGPGSASPVRTQHVTGEFPRFLGPPVEGNTVGQIAGNEYSPVSVTVRPAPNHAGWCRIDACSSSGLKSINGPWMRPG
ncbi:hypothetical protein E4U50_007184 [Claviceps purpurea]|nr:hypothetical protein E4U51_007943 [Claviceps purpurea]KAG6215627.1 hypothetical protein E4U50_007184 [Claviceps purpurea]